MNQGVYGSVLDRYERVNRKIVLIKFATERELRVL